MQQEQGAAPGGSLLLGTLHADVVYVVQEIRQPDLESLRWEQ